MILNIVKIYPVERQSTLLMPRILVRVIRIHAYRIRTIGGNGQLVVKGAMSFS